MASASFKVILACRSQARGEEARAKLTALGADVECMTLDIDSTASISAFTAAVAAKYNCIDVLINNAAIAFKHADPTPFEQQAAPTLRPNFFGTLQLTEELLPLIKKSPRPTIVTVASVAGHLKILKSEEKKALFLCPDLTMQQLRGYMQAYIAEAEAQGENNSWSRTNYGMSKLGVICMTRILAREEPTVKVNCYCPGYCATDMSSHRGPRSAEQGAETALVLATLDAAGPTGKFYSLGEEAQW